MEIEDERGEAETEIGEKMEAVVISGDNSQSAKLLQILRRFLTVQRRRAEAYAKLRRGFDEYMTTGGDLGYQQLCEEITVEFNDCSKQVLEMESLLLAPELSRDDLASIFHSVQVQEKQKLHMTAKMQVLKKTGHPSERLVSHESCRFNKSEHECVHLHDLTEAAGTEEAEANADYHRGLKEAICGMQDAVTKINEHLEEVRYEIEALETD